MIKNVFECEKNMFLKKRNKVMSVVIGYFIELSLCSD